MAIGTLFPESDEGTIVAEIRSERLITAAASYFPQVSLTDDYIYKALLAAEQDLSHQLRVLFVPTNIVPEGTDPSVTDGYDAASPPIPWIDESAYDWDPEFFQGNRWGMIQLRQTPVISVESIKFVYPSTDQNMFTIPTPWIRLDKKYGQVNLVPTGNATTLPLNAWLLQVFSGGSVIPHMMQIAYTAGLADAERDYPELIDLIKKMAVMRMLEDQFVPQSGSLSVDGLSQSIGVDMAKFGELLEKRVEKLRSVLKGVRVGFL